MERHFQTLLLSVLTAAILALVAFIWNAQTALTTLSVKLSQVSEDLSRASDSIQVLANTAETKADHARDMAQSKDDASKAVAFVQTEVTDHEIRLRKLENASVR